MEGITRPTDAPESCPAGATPLPHAGAPPVPAAPQPSERTRAPTRELAADETDRPRDTTGSPPAVGEYRAIVHPGTTSRIWGLSMPKPRGEALANISAGSAGSERVRCAGCTRGTVKTCGMIIGSSHRSLHSSSP
jgi:hypothetical protein